MTPRPSLAPAAGHDPKAPEHLKHQFVPPKRRANLGPAHHPLDLRHDLPRDIHALPGGELGPFSWARLILSMIAAGTAAPGTSLFMNSALAILANGQRPPRKGTRQKAARVKNFSKTATSTRRRLQGFDRRPHGLDMGRGGSTAASDDLDAADPGHPFDALEHVFRT